MLIFFKKTNFVGTTKPIWVKKAGKNSSYQIL
jgi:hypothetical protein